MYEGSRLRSGDVTNFGGDGTWVPLTSVEVYGSAALYSIKTIKGMYQDD